MIRPCGSQDFAAILEIVNDGAEAYRGAIPEDCWHEPYMSEAELRREIAAGVRFFGYADEDGDDPLLGVMGVQDVDDVVLVRHAYVRTAAQRRGIGGALLGRIKELATAPLLVGTWAAADWAVRFYRRYGFRLVDEAEKERLLRAHWTISDRQIETSVVLAEANWRAGVS